METINDAKKHPLNNPENEEEFIQSYQSTPEVIRLFEAVKSGSVEEVQLLLNQGIDPNTRNRVGAVPLVVASSPEVARVLIAA